MFSTVDYVDYIDFDSDNFTVIEITIESDVNIICLFLLLFLFSLLFSYTSIFFSRWTLQDRHSLTVATCVSSLPFGNDGHVNVRNRFVLPGLSVSISRN